MNTQKRSLTELAVPVTVFSSFIISAVCSVIFVATGLEGDGLIFWSYAVPQLAFILVTAIYFSVNRLNFFAEIPVVKEVKPAKLMWSLLTIAGFFCFALLPNVLINYIFTQAGLTLSVEVPALSGAKNIILSIIIICILPSIGEELVFRGVAAGAMKGYDPKITVLVSGALFALYHLNIAQTVYQFCIGAVLCFIFIKTGSLIYASLMHFVNNALALFLSEIPFFAGLGLNAKSLPALVIMFILGGALFLFSLVQLTAEGGTVKEKLMNAAGTVKRLFGGKEKAVLPPVKAGEAKDAEEKGMETADGGKIVLKKKLSVPLAATLIIFAVIWGAVIIAGL